MSHANLVLQRLKQSAGTVVPLAELKAAGWPGRDLSQDKTIVGAAVYLLRVAGHKIETVKGVGYTWHKGPEPRSAAAVAEPEGAENPLAGARGLEGDPC